MTWESNCQATHRDVTHPTERRATSVLVTWENNCQATHRDVTHLRSSQEEADTKMTLHAVMICYDLLCYDLFVCLFVFFFMLKLLQYCNYKIIVMQIKLILLLLSLLMLLPIEHQKSTSIRQTLMSLYFL